MSFSIFKDTRLKKKSPQIKKAIPYFDSSTSSELSIRNGLGKTALIKILLLPDQIDSFSAIALSAGEWCFSLFDLRISTST